jgi:hypothetical protein
MHHITIPLPSSSPKLVIKGARSNVLSFAALVDRAGESLVNPSPIPESSKSGIFVVSNCVSIALLEPKLVLKLASCGWKLGASVESGVRRERFVVWLSSKSSDWRFFIVRDGPAIAGY